MNHTFEQLGYYHILEKLSEQAVTNKAKEQMEEVGIFFVSVNRLKAYLERGRDRQISLAYYGDNLTPDMELADRIQYSIRHGRVDDGASKYLADTRRQLTALEEKIREKAETALKVNKSYLTDSFVVTRNGHVCIPVKKQFRGKVKGILVDSSGAGMTVFIEPETVGNLREELDILKICEEEEERRILYMLMAEIADREAALKEDIRTIGKLDFVFAKGKLSLVMEATEPEINTKGYIRLQQARHPELSKEHCVPLDFEIGGEKRGVVITGPNTGGKTVTIKTVALLNLMACAGLHVPAEKAEIAMTSQVLCDIGDGQSMDDNLSTFSAHIKNVISILEKVNNESLVVLDELGSGTDPAEGMGIAIAILEELRESRALFLVTTHYPEVKTYADRHSEIGNASMAFDRESLRPMYLLEQGKSGDSCALYIAKRLGLPERMLKLAAKEAYGEVSRESDEMKADRAESVRGPRIRRMTEGKKAVTHGTEFQRGDSVSVLPEGKVGIVVKSANKDGNVLVQIKREKQMINHKRLKVLVAATELYPEDYDFSVVFDSVEERKRHHLMERKYVED